MQKPFLFVVIFMLSQFLWAQSTPVPQEGEVKKVIQRMFEGMRSGDSSMVRSVFYAGARLQSTSTDAKTGKPVLRDDSIEGFIKAIGTPHPDVWDERLLGYEIKIDDNLAIAWTPYEFYRGSTFSHRGVNVFQLFKSENGWKIIAIADTRRK